MSEQQQRRLLVLGSMPEFVKLVQMAKARGYYTVVADGYANGPAKALADAAYDVDIRDAEAVADICAKENIGGMITAYSDLLAECHTRIAEKAGLDAYLTPDKIINLRDKGLMQDMFDQLQVPYPKTVRIDGTSTAADLASLHFPIITKPANAWGSRGVIVMTTPEEVIQRFPEVSQYSAEDFILVQEYNDGFEFNMMNWVCEGEPVVLSIADREKSPNGPNSLPHCSCVSYPSRLTDCVMEEARAIVAKVAHFLDYDNGPLCMQFFWSPDRGVQVCECAGRIFGYEHDQLEFCTYGKLTIEDLLLDRAFDKEACIKRLQGHDPHLPGCSTVLYFHAKQGVVDHIDGLPAESTPEVFADTLTFVQPGEEFVPGDGRFPYASRVYLWGDNRADIDEMTDRLYQSVAVIGTDGEVLSYTNVRMSYDSLAALEN